MLKLISIVLSFSLIFSSVAPSYAEGFFAKKQQETLQQKIEEAVTNADPEETTEGQLRLVFEQLEKLAKGGDYDPNFQGAQFRSADAKRGSDMISECSNRLRMAEEDYMEKNGTKSEEDFLTNGYICTPYGDGQICSNPLAFAKACSAVALDIRWNGKDKLKALEYTEPTYDVKAEKTVYKTFNSFAFKPREHRNFHTQGEDVEIVEWLSDYWTLGSTEKAFNYLVQVVNIPNACTDADADDLFQVRIGECELALSALNLMADVAQVYPQYKDKVADEAFALMKRANREDLAAAAIMQGTTALMGLNTDKSYELLSKFLDKETNPSALDHLGTLNVEGLVDFVSSIGSNRQYYNTLYSRRLDYMDPVLLDTWYDKEHFKHPVLYAFTGREVVDTVHWGEGFSDRYAVYQFPMGNILEDIGVLLARDSAKNTRSAALAQTIFNDAINYREKREALRFPNPLFAGVVLGGFGGEKGKAELQRLKTTTFVDLNEGTQRRLRMNADKALKGQQEAQEIDNNESAYRSFIKQYTEEDHGKYKDFSLTTGAKAMGFAVDIFLILWFFTSIIKGVIRLATTIPAAMSKMVQGVRSVAVKGLGKASKHWNAMLKSSNRLAFRAKPGAITAETGAAAKTTTTAAKTTTTAARTTTTAAKTTATASKTVGTAANAGKASNAAKATANAGKTAKKAEEGSTIVLKGIDAGGNPILEPLQTPAKLKSGTLALETSGAVKAESVVASIGEGGAAAAASAESWTAPQAAARIRHIESETLIFKGTPLEQQFKNALNEALKAQRNAAKAAGENATRLSEVRRMRAYEQAFKQTTEGIEYLDAAGVSQATAATAFTRSTEINVMNAAAKASGKTPRIWTDADFPWTLRARLAVELFWDELKSAAGGIGAAATTHTGRATLAAIAGMANPAVTGEAIKSTQMIAAEMSRPAIILVADTKNTGMLSVNLVKGAGAVAPTRPILIPRNKLPVTLMSFEEASAILTPLFLNMGLKTYDEIFSEETIYKAFDTDPDAALAYYTFDKEIERTLQTAVSSGKNIGIVDPVATEIVGEAPAQTSSSIVSDLANPIKLNLNVDLTNPVQVSQFAERVVAGSKAPSTGILGSVAAAVTGITGRTQDANNKQIISNYVADVLVEADKQLAADPSLTHEAAFVNAVAKVLGEDELLSDEIKASFVEEVAKIVESNAVAEQAPEEAPVSYESFEVSDFSALAVTDEKVIKAQSTVLPVAAKTGVLFRGMALSADGASLKNIFANGLLLADVTADSGTLMRAMSGGMNLGAMLVTQKLSRNINLTNSPKDAGRWGARKLGDLSKQVLVVTEVSGIDAPSERIVNYMEDIAPENITAVYALLEVNGQPMWCRVEMTENGMYKVTPMNPVSAQALEATGTAEELLKNKRFAETVRAVQDDTNKEFIASSKKTQADGKTVAGQEAYNQLFKQNLVAAVRKDPRFNKFAGLTEDELYQTAQQVLNPKAERQVEFSLQLRDADGKVLPITFPLVLNLLDKTAVSQLTKMDITDSETFTLRPKNGVFELMVTTPGGSERGIYQPFIQGGKAEAEALYYRLLGDYQAGKFANGTTPTVYVNLYSDVHAERATLFAGLTEGLGGLPQSTVAPFATALNVSDPKQMQSAVSHSQLGNVASVVFSGLQKALGIKNTLGLGLAVATLGLAVCAYALTLPTIAAKVALLGAGSFILGVGANGGVKSTNSIYAKELSNDNTTGTARMGFVNARASIGTMTGYLFFPVSVLFALTGIPAFKILYLGAMAVPAYALYNLMRSKVRNVSQLDSSVQGFLPISKEVAKAVWNVFKNIFDNVKFAITGGFAERAAYLRDQRAARENAKQYKKIIAGEAVDANPVGMEGQETSVVQKALSRAKDAVEIDIPAFFSQYLLKMMLVVGLYHFAGMAFNSGPGAIIGKWMGSEAGLALVNHVQNMPLTGLTAVGAAAGALLGFIGQKVVGAFSKKTPAQAKMTDSPLVTALKASIVPLITAAVAGAVTFFVPQAAGVVATVLSRIDTTALAQLLTFFAAYIGVWAGRQFLSGLVKSGKISPQGIIGISGLWSTVTTGLAFLPGMPLVGRAALWMLAGLGFANLAGFENSLAMEKYPNQKPAVNMAYTLARLSGALTSVYGAFAMALSTAGIPILSAAPDVYALTLPAGALLAATLINRKYFGNFKEDVKRWWNLPPDLTYQNLRAAADTKYRSFIETGKYAKYEQDVADVSKALFDGTSHNLRRIEQLLDSIQYKLTVNAVRLETIAVLREMLNGNAFNGVSLNAKPLSYSVFTRQEVHPLIKGLSNEQMVNPEARKNIIRSAAVAINSRYYITKNILDEIEAGVKRRQEGLDGFRADVLREMYKLELTKVAESRAQRYAGSRGRYDQSMKELQGMAEKVIGPNHGWVAPAFQPKKAKTPKTGKQK